MKTKYPSVQKFKQAKARRELEESRKARKQQSVSVTANRLLRIMPPIVNRVGSVRRVQYRGREWLVAPLTLIMPDAILDGSQGAGLYPSAENRRNPEAWSGVPLIVYHPQTTDGRHVSAKEAGVVERQGVGLARNARADAAGKLIADGWFDVERTRLVDPRVLEALENNKPIELSTGLYLEGKEKAPAGAPYEWVARGYIPDHVAILPDALGACSVTAGCGVNVVNQTPKANDCKCQCDKCKPKELHMNDYRTFQIYNDKWNAEARDKLSKESPDDFAGPNQSFPIRDQDDVDHAARLVGHAENPEAVKRKIISIAKRKGLSIPDSWQSNGDDDSDDPTENMWSDAAREASIQARRAHAASRNTPFAKESSIALEMTRTAGREGTEKAHVAAAAKHAGLESSHRLLSESAQRQGNSRLAASHKEAAVAHLGAQKAHESAVSRMTMARNSNSNGGNRMQQPENYNSDTYRGAYADQIDAVRPVSRMAAEATARSMPAKPTDMNMGMAANAGLALRSVNSGNLQKAAAYHNLAATLHDSMKEDTLRVGDQEASLFHDDAAKAHQAAYRACCGQGGGAPMPAVNAFAPHRPVGPGSVEVSPDKDWQVNWDDIYREQASPALLERLASR